MCPRLLSLTGVQYMTASIHNCTGKRLSAPFAGPIDRRSLILQDDYIFLKVPSLLLSESAARPRGV